MQAPAPEQPSFEARRKSAEHLRMRLLVLATHQRPSFANCDDQATKAERSNLRRVRNDSFRLAPGSA
jgi:hypothetical protein